MKRGIVLGAVCAAAVVVGCDRNAVAPLATGGITLRFVPEPVAPEATETPQPPTLSLQGHLDAARARVFGPKNDSLNLAAVPSGFSGTVVGLPPGSYTVAVEGLVANEVDYFVQVSSVPVTAGRNTDAAIPSSSFRSFRPALAELGPPTTEMKFTARWPRVANALSYKVEWDKNPSFASAASTTVADTFHTDTILAPITVNDTGTYNVRVRAVNALEAGGRASDAKSMWVVGTPPPLQNGVPISGLAGALGSQRYFAIQVPSGQAQLTVTISGGTGDANIYLRRDSLPTQSRRDCESVKVENSEQCSILNPPGGNWYVLLQGGAAYSGVSLAAAYWGPPTQMTTNSALSQSGMVGTAAPAPPAVLVRDAGNNPVPNVAVTFTVTAGGGTTVPPSPAVVNTNASGIAALASWTLGPAAGTDNNVVTVTAAGASGTPLAGSPVTFKGSGTPLLVVGRSPTPYVRAASFIAPTSSFSATFSAAMAAATASTFVVNSSQRGRWFLGGTYGGTGTTTLSTPAASFYPGEEVEVVLTTGLTAASGGAHLAAPLVTRYRVATTAAPGSFTPASGSPVATGSRAFSVALGDVNGDGKLDLVTANYGANSVTVLLGNRDGTFTAAAGSPVAVGTGPVFVALGDLNGDGKLDLVTGNINSNNVTVLLGNGSGTFTAASGSPVAVGLSPYTVAVGDVNGDGKLDLVTANEGSNTVTVLLGNGDGTFTVAAGSPVAVGSFPYSVTVGDVNGDGKLDLTTVNSGSNNVTVLLGNGDGTFTAPGGSPAVVSNSVFGALGDVNGDGKLDLVTANYGSNNVTVLLGNGNGTFTAASGSPVTVGFAPNSVALGDVNGDGKLDLVVANGDSNTLTVMLGIGDGTFTAAAGSPVAVGSGPHSVALGDLNGDGKLDLVAANSLSINVTVLLNQVPVVPTPPTNLTARPVSLGEIDLSWIDNATNEEGFRIERCTGPACTTFTQVATVGPNVTAYPNTGLPAGTNYTYQVQAYNTAGNSAPSNAAASTTPFLLQNGVPATDLAAATGSELYFAIQVPSGQSQLTVTINGGTGNADLYVRFGSVPTLSVWDCRPLSSDNSEQCSFSSPSAGDWYIVLHGVPFSGVTLTATYRSAPAPAPPPAVSAGGSHSCGVTPAGGAYCWGDNSSGQLGNGTTAMSTSPVAVTGGGLSFERVSAGTGHTCAVTMSGAAYCWGDNPFGQLGNATNTSSSIPVAVSGGLTFQSVSAGQGHSCGVTTSRAAYCWGADGDGALGNGTATNSSSPVAVSGGLTFQSVSAGAGYTCGVTTTGAAYCWGVNAAGALGNGTTTRSLTPVAVSGGLTFRSVSAGNLHTCGVTAGGAAYCWGAGDNGRLGNGATGNSPIPVPVSGGLAFESVSVGVFHSCGATSSGAAYCWGANPGGELGNGTTTSSTAPVPVSGGVILGSVSAGGSHTCAVTTSGAAYCWGQNFRGQAGDGSPLPTIPGPVSGGLTFGSVSSGGFFTCGLTTAAYCWGNNSIGQLGNGSFANSNVPVAVSGGLTFASVSSGFAHTCAVTATQTAYCWGRNVEGELGSGSGASSSDVPVQVSGGLFFASLSAASNHSCGVTNGEAVYCWGDNSVGQLGDGTTTNSSAPVVVSGGLSYQLVSAGTSHTCGVATSGAAYCWGDNTSGQLGNGTATSSTAPVAVAGGLTFQSLSAGDAHTCGVTTSGAAYCWGAGDYGRLGNGATSNRSIPVAVSGGLTFRSVIAGTFHTCGVTTNGAVYCWGDNSYGALGNGTTTGSTIPVAVSGGLTFASVSTGFFHTCAVPTSGPTYCWGYNLSGQLGNGTTSTLTTPVPVVGGLTFKSP